MNRKQRRAFLKQSRPAAGARPEIDPAAQLYAKALRLQQQNRPDDAVHAYKRLLLQNPDHAEAINNLACILQAQGKRAEASARFARALSLRPQLFDRFSSVCAILVSLLPELGEAMQRASAAWPARLSIDQLLGHTGIDAIAADPLLLCTLRAAPIRDLALERMLTSLRAVFLADAAAGRPPARNLDFISALARQCFINEYVFAIAPEEDEQLGRLRIQLAGAIANSGNIEPSTLAIAAAYLPLNSIVEADTLLARDWPAPVTALLKQQLNEPAQERHLRGEIPRLTTIDDDVSLRVQQQYEENPYPRWVNVAGGVEPIAVDRYLRELFPSGAFTPLGKTDTLDILAAGCGTGWQAIGLAQRFAGARVLAVDLSLSSLAYAKRQTPEALARQIDYAQADILKLDTAGRSFDLVDSSGVLHHMSDPMRGWRILHNLLRPGGLMHLGFYSELGRRDIIKARAFIAERGYGSTPDEIRRCRQDIASTQLQSLIRVNDFFSTSECRDMLFHVQEHRLAIPALKAFMAEHGLKFLGFEFDQAAMRKYRVLFAQSGWSITDLDRWHGFEMKFPDTFAGMYHFWAQKN